MQKDFYAIGHITDDLEPYPHVGGGVTYSSVVAKRLGLTPHIITKCAIDSPYIKELEDMGVQMHVLPLRDKTKEHATVSFKNVYDSVGNRTQYCSVQQEAITEEDLANFPEIVPDSTILIAPVIGKVSFSLFAILSQKGHVAVTPQGYFRAFAEDGKVSQKPLEDVSFFRNAEEVILSEEDLAFDDGRFFPKLKEVSPLLIQTHGEKGSSVYKNGNEVLQIPAYPLNASEIIDYTGAGDSYATAFLVKKAEGATDEDAGYFASFYAAMKISGLGGGKIGLSTIPTKDQIATYIITHQERVNNFHKFTTQE